MMIEDFDSMYDDGLAVHKEKLLGSVLGMHSLA